MKKIKRWLHIVLFANTLFVIAVSALCFMFASDAYSAERLSIVFGACVTGVSVLLWFVIRGLCSAYEAEKRRVEDKLRKSENRLFATLNSIGDAVIVVDSQGSVRQMNPVAEKLTGWSKDDAIGRPVSDVFCIKGSEKDESVQDLFKEILEIGTTAGANNHTVMISRDGSEYYISGNRTPVLDQEGTILGAVVVFRDVTERHKRDEMMRIMQFSIDNAPEEILWLNSEGSICYMNDAGCRSLGYSREEILSMTVYDINPRLKKNSWQAFWDNVKRHGHALAESVRKRKDGSVYPVGIVAGYIGFDDREVCCVFARDITEQKRAREILEDNYNELQQYIDNHLTFTARLTSNGILTMVNSVAVEAIGCSKDELIGRPFYDTYWWKHDKDVRNELKKWIKRVSKGETIITEASLNTVHGVRYVSFSLNPVTDKCGNIVYIIAEAQDITDIKKAQNVLKKSHKLFNSISTFAGILDASGRLEFVNKTAVLFLGYEDKDVIGVQFWDNGYIDPLSRADVKKAVLAAMKGETTQMEITCVTREGRKLPVLFSALPILENTGVISGVIVEGVDISELRETEKMYEILLNASPDGIIMTDMRTYKNLYGNPAICRMLGYTEKELKEKTIYDFYPKDVVAQITSLTGSEAETGTHVIEDIPVLRKDGDLVDTEMSITTVRADGMEIMVGFVRDITEKKRLEKQMMQMQKMEAIGAIAGGIAHDFNNILSPILGYGELIKQRANDEYYVTRYAEQIVQSSSRAKDLVQQILTFSRQNDEEKRPVLIQPILKEVLKLLMSSVPSNIKIRKYVDPDCGAVMANSIHMHQVFMNLCINAFQAMPDGGILEVRLTEKEVAIDNDPPERYVNITVRDTGCGIDPVIRDRIFEPYFTTKGPDKGTGMGLAIVYGIVKDAGGYIDVKSEPGKGTTFNIYLPLIEQKNAVTETVTEEGLKGGNECILVVDDEEMIALMLREMLEALGYSVSHRTSSVEALNLFKAKSDSFDLVITDMTMPNMNGLELISKIKKIRPDIPVFICTGFSEQLTDEEAEALGIAMTIMKPVSLERLDSAVRDVLERRKKSAG